MSIDRLLQVIMEGEPVSPGTPNRPLLQLDKNVKYLWDIIQAANLGSTVYARQQTIEPDLKVGMPVYYNEISQRFERALANMETETGTGQIVTSASSQVWGIVAEKFNSTLADLLLYGYANIDISEAMTDINAPVAAGNYYLSGQTQGKLVQSRPPVSVPVLRADGNGNVLVNPTVVDFLDSHRHYRFELTASPAGQHTQPIAGQAHVIDSPDANLPGWLPAGHATFDGLAPDGAKFGYNLKADEKLYGLWPPLPIHSCELEILRPSIYSPTPREVLPLAGAALDDLVVINREGIWWMSDCYDEVPWPTNLETNSSVSESVAGADECPRSIDVRILLWFTRVSFATEASVVTTLRSTDDRLKIYCRNTTMPGTAGDLDIDLDLQLTLGDNTQRGFRAFKGLDGDKILSGPVTEGVYATSANILLTSQFQTYLTPDDPSTPRVHHGLTGIGVLTEPTRELSSQLVRLDGTTEEHYPVLYLGFPTDQESSFVVKFEVPADAPDNSVFTYRSRLLGRVAGNTPQLTVEYNIASRPTAGLTVPQAVASSWTPLTIDTVATLNNADESVEATSSEVSIVPGDIIYIKVTRDPNDASDEYPGELGIMQQVGILASGS